MTQSDLYRLHLDLLDRIDDTSSGEAPQARLKDLLADALENVRRVVAELDRAEAHCRGLLEELNLVGYRAIVAMMEMGMPGRVAVEEAQRWR